MLGNYYFDYDGYQNHLIHWLFSKILWLGGDKLIGFKSKGLPIEQTDPTNMNILAKKSYLVVASKI